MRSYYTYGAIPDPVQTVRGFDDGGLATVPSDSTWKGDVSSGQGIMDFFNLQRERELGPGALQSFAGPTGTAPVQPGQFSLYNPNERSASQVAADYAKASGLDLAGFAKSQGMSETELMGQINKSEMDPNTQRGALNEIKSLAGAGDFQGAFQAAKAAEARMPGQDFVSTLVSPESLRYITPEMDKKDVDNYFDALKNVVGEKEYEQRYVGEGNKMSLDQAKERSMQAIDQGAGFVNPSLGVKAEETLLSKLPVKQLTALAAAAMAVAGFAPGLFGAGSAGTTGAAGGAGAGTAGAAGTAGTAGAAGGAGAAGAAGTAGALGAAGATSVLPEVVVAATKLGLTVPQYLAIAGGTGALASTVGSSGAATTAPTTQPSAPSEPSGGLEEVVVKAKPPVTPPVVPPVIVPPAGGLTTPPTEPTFPETDLEEVEVKAKKPPPVEPPPVITPPLSPPTEPPPADGELEEVEVKAKKPPQPDIPPPVIVPPPSPPPPEPPPADGGLEEVEVTAKRPPPVIAPPVIITPPLTPPPDPKDILKDYKPTKIEDPSSPLEDLLKDPKNILKILGALGSATSGGGGGTTGGVGAGTGTGAFGGALPKYTYERQQLSPPIDYYTYGTRPEAKFFEGTYKLAEPTQPAMVPPPSEPSGVVTSAVGGLVDENMTGGLIGYAKGGDAKPERYVDGPGSGREDLIPAMLSDGEYVIDAETLALLGDGSTKEGARRMDQFRAKIRQHKGRALSRGRISPNAKSPEKYMGGGLS